MSVDPDHGPVHPSVSERLARLAPDQRDAAVAPPGPILCVAPAGSGKTTTLVARVAWLIASGAAVADEITAITFNKRAADELRERLAGALAPLGGTGGRGDQVRVRTFHALGLEILRDSGATVEPLVDRMSLLRRVAPDAGPVGWRALDTAISRLKLDMGVDAAAVAADPDAGMIARTFVAYEAALAETGGLDFDDLVARAVRTLEADAELLERWRGRCAHLLVDEAQDLDRAQLRMALLLAAPANRVFFVGDDDQSIYGWRLADVRRVLSLDASLPGLRRVDLEVNYRCPAPVIERAVRLVEHNRERFAKRVVARPGAVGRLVLAPDASDDTVRLERAMAAWPDDDGTQAVLARTNSGLLPGVVVCLELGLEFRSPELPLPLESEELGRLLDKLLNLDDGPLLVQVSSLGRSELARALLAWAPRYPDRDAFVAAVCERRDRLAALRRDDANLTLATAHSTKGLEFDHVVVLADGFPSQRSVAESDEPARALEEERRLAYVAWTRARRTLTLLHDPTAPSLFLEEAFGPTAASP